MPSPIAHSLIGLAIGIASLPPPQQPDTGPSRWRGRAGWLLGCVVVANGPDIDFLPGLLIGNLNAFHHQTTHSVGWILLVGLGLWFLARTVQPQAPVSLLLLLWLLLGSHLLADYLCEDRSAPFGMPLGWPLSSEFRISSRPLFLAMEKGTLREVFTRPNLPAALREVGIGASLVLVALLARRAVRRA